MINKYKVLYEWLKTYGDLQGFLYFNTSDMQDGNTSLNSQESEKTTRTYIDGSYEADLPFVISMVNKYDSEQSDLNLEAMNIVDGIMKWIEDNQESLYFGEDYEVYDIEITSGTPNISVDTKNFLAKYQISGKVHFLYKNNNFMMEE